MILLRSALFNAWFFGITAVLGLVGAVVRAVRPERALAFAGAWARAVLAGARVLCGIRVEITGLDQLPAGAALLASQHQSAFDTLVWAALLPDFTYVYKAELARIPLFGPMLVAAGQIPLNRGASVASVRALLRATAAAAAAGRKIIIFPEGTRVAVGAETSLKGGVALLASRTGLPIYPVATDSGAYWGRRAFTKRPGVIRVHVGAPLPAGLAGPALEQALRQRWRDAGLSTQSVDKPVDFPSATAAIHEAPCSRSPEQCGEIGTDR